MGAWVAAAPTKVAYVLSIVTESPTLDNLERRYALYCRKDAWF